MVRSSLLLTATIALTACSSTSTTEDTKSDGGTTTDASTPAKKDGGAASPTALTVNAQTPPQTNAADVEAWLAKGEYKAWHCEAAAHEARSPSPHGWNRICSNDLTANFSGTGERPKGSAGVKEIYDDGGKTITGYAVYVKSADTSADGANWYWFERVAKDVVADGFGGAGTPKSICVGCHAGAGSDPAHTPTKGASDQVYTQVP